MGEQFEQAKKLVHNHVLWEQEMLIDGMLKAGLLPEEYIYPFVDEEVLEWWLVTPYLARKLKGQGEIILEAYDCHWWGRLTSGQAIYLASAIQSICGE